MQRSRGGGSVSRPNGGGGGDYQWSSPGTGRVTGENWGDWGEVGRWEIRASPRSAGTASANGDAGPVLRALARPSALRRRRRGGVSGVMPTPWRTAAGWRRAIGCSSRCANPVGVWRLIFRRRRLSWLRVTLRCRASFWLTVCGFVALSPQRRPHSRCPASPFSKSPIHGRLPRRRSPVLSRPSSHLSFAHHCRACAGVFPFLSGPSRYPNCAGTVRWL